jgi:mRNA interferase RelE/StbE
VNTEFKESFLKDLRKIRNAELLNHIASVIEQIEEANGVSGINNLKKLKGESAYYRIRMGDYRIGLIIKNDLVTFVRFLNRKEIYRYFPKK